MADFRWADDGKMMTELLTALGGGVLTITINRPASRNTVTYAVLDALLDAFAAGDADEAVRAIVVTGAGETFSYGTELSSGAGGFDADTAAFKPLRGGRRDVGGELALRIFNSTKPVIAAVNGTAVGIGVTMILPMDVRIAADSARFGLPFTRRGIVPESCATWFLPRIVGIATAVDWAVTGRIFDAQEAFARGLVGELRPADEVLPRAQELAAAIAGQTSAVSVALTRQMLWRQLGSPHPLSANRLESKALLALGAMADAKEGVSAFKEKRPPAFTLSVPRDLPGFYPWFQEEPFDADS
jgi:enoyl-CoA hydratase/carnithine racemase